LTEEGGVAISGSFISDLGVPSPARFSAAAEGVMVMPVGELSSPLRGFLRGLESPPARCWFGGVWGRFRGVFELDGWWKSSKKVRKKREFDLQKTANVVS